MSQSAAQANRESLIASTTRNELVGTVAADEAGGPGSVSVAERVGMDTTKWVPFHVALHFTEPVHNSARKAVVSVFAIPLSSESEEALSQAHEKIRSASCLEATQFRAELGVEEALSFFKRVEIQMSHGSKQHREVLVRDVVESSAGAK